MPSDDHPPVLDRAGAPMIWVPTLETGAPAPGAYLHLLPVTKLHFESFLCAQPQSRFDADWYETVLRVHGDRSGRAGRVPVAQIQANNYWKAFLTGVRPDEAQLYADWNGRERDSKWVYELPTKRQWLAAYTYLREPTSRVPVFDDLPLSARTRALLERIADTVGGLLLPDPRLAATQMLMRFGVMEWIRPEPGESVWGGFGRTHPNFMACEDNIRDGKPLPRPRAADERAEQFGFRLIRRPVAAPARPPAREGDV